jgi:hypothetical protein
MWAAPFGKRGNGAPGRATAQAAGVFNGGDTADHNPGPSRSAVHQWADRSASGRIDPSGGAA